MQQIKEILITQIILLFATVHGQGTCNSIENRDKCQAIEFCFWKEKDCNCLDLCKEFDYYNCGKYAEFCNSGNCYWDAYNNQCKRTNFLPQCNLDSKNPCGFYICSKPVIINGKCSQRNDNVDECGLYYSKNLCRESYSQSEKRCAWKSGKSQMKCIDACQFLRSQSECESSLFGNGCSFVCQWDNLVGICYRKVEFSIPTYEANNYYPCKFDRCSKQFNSQCANYEILNDPCGFYYNQELCYQVKDLAGCIWKDDIKNEKLMCADRCSFENKKNLSVLNNCFAVCNQSFFPRRNFKKEFFITSNGISCPSNKCVQNYSKQCVTNQRSKLKEQ